ncbi:MAG TPA: 7-cyano-7-deazaguanine synthase [Blastocatellia bacterium]|nr:7-cyano-7-deazaguanine synthase [Blastocatellia bacterium]
MGKQSRADERESIAEGQGQDPVQAGEKDNRLNSAQRGEDSGGNSSICVLTSGGLDSGVLVAEATTHYDGVWPVFVRSGLRWEEVELFWLTRFLQSLSAPALRPLRVLDFPLTDIYGQHWSTGGGGVPGREAPLDSVYLPGRNIILLAKAAVFCSLAGIKEIAIGTLRANPFPDASAEFFRRIGEVFSEGLAYPVRVCAPYHSLSKAEVIRLGARWPLELTFSCISPEGNHHCGLCSKCAERHQAFVDAGIPDPTLYATNFPSS